MPAASFQAEKYYSVKMCFRGRARKLLGVFEAVPWPLSLPKRSGLRDLLGPGGPVTPEQRLRDGPCSASPPSSSSRGPREAGEPWQLRCTAPIPMETGEKLQNLGECA